MEHSQPIHLSTVYGLWEICPQKTKYLLCSLLEKSPPTTALHQWPQSFSVCQMATLYLVTCSYCLSFFSLANQSASDRILDFVITALRTLGLSSSACQQYSIVPSGLVLKSSWYIFWCFLRYSLLILLFSLLLPVIIKLITSPWMDKDIGYTYRKWNIRHKKRMKSCQL